MRDMAVCQDHAIVAHPGLPAVTGSAMDGNKFPDGRIIANLHRRLFPVKLKVLRISRNNRTWEDPAISADSGALHNGHITSDPGSGSDLNIFMNHCEWVHLYIGG